MDGTRGALPHSLYNTHLPHCDCDHGCDDHDDDAGHDDWQRKVDFMFPKLNVTLDIGRIFQ